MRVLLDTNIVIYRENKKMTNYSIGHLFRWLDKLKYDKLIHPLTKKEISEYHYADPAEAMTLKLDAYQELKTQAPLAKQVEELAVIMDNNENDSIDTVLLNEVYQKVPIGSLDVNNEFFDSLRAAYEGFNTWFNKKCDEDAYVCLDDNGQMLGFLYLKPENVDENYSDISPIFPRKKRLKIGTFKVDATGFRLGERFVKIIFDNAIEQDVDEIYVTMFDNRPELETLATLLARWGFESYGVKESTGEKVFTKQMKQYLPELSTRENFPNLKRDTQKFIMPILPKYHTSLLPDSILRNENENDFLAKTPYRYALQKAYISFAHERNIHPGDFVVFYRNGVPGNAGHTAVLTSVAVVDEAITNFKTKEEYMGYVQNRSVFTNEELEEFWHKHGSNQIVLKFIFVTSLNKRPVLKFLWDENIIEFPQGPRPFTRITDRQFDRIMDEAQTDLSRYWR